MAKSYNYKPMRLSSGQMGKLTHKAASHHVIRAYNEDKKIAARSSAELKLSQKDSVAAPDASVPKQVPNPGNPLQFGRESLYSSSPLPDSKMDLPEAARVHHMQSCFHTSRSLIALDAARNHSIAGVNRDEEVDMKANLPEPGPVMPSLFDVHEASTHDFDKALEYHSHLRSEALLEAHGYRRMAEQLGTRLLDNTPDTGKLVEAKEVCHGMCEMMSQISELHSMYAGSISDYLLRRQDKDPDRDQDTQVTNPSGHTGDGFAGGNDGEPGSTTSLPI